MTFNCVICDVSIVNFALQKGQICNFCLARIENAKRSKEIWHKQLKKANGKMLIKQTLDRWNIAYDLSFTNEKLLEKLLSVCYGESIASVVLQQKG